MLGPLRTAQLGDYQMIDVEEHAGYLGGGLEWRSTPTYFAAVRAGPYEEIAA